MKQKEIITENQSLKLSFTHFHRTENAALAGGAPSTSKVAKRYEREVDTSVNVADRTFLSRHKNALVYKAFLKAVEGLEPSRGEVSTSLSHHATAWRGLYHIGSKREETLT